jgi:hypothetical protein
MSRRFSLILLAGVLLFGQLAANALADEPSPPATLLTKPGKLLVDEKLAELPAKGDWRYGPGDWTIVDGVLKGSERKEDKHGAVLRRNLKQRDAVIRYDFRLDGARGTTLSMNDAKEHVCRVMIGPKYFRAQKDDHDHDGPDKAVPFQSLAINVEPGQWHTLVVEMRGPEMVATLDGKHVSFGSEPLLDTEKANFGFTVAGESVSFRNLQVWAALENTDWPTKKAELEKLRTASAAK